VGPRPCGPAQCCRGTLQWRDEQRCLPRCRSGRITAHRLRKLQLMSQALDLTRDLLARRSITPADEGCQELISARLLQIAFVVEPLPFGNVTNLWARRGRSRPVFCFAGHTDVVPSGPLEEWHSDPFVPALRDGVLYGRGAADMKSGLAAMVTAT